MPLHTTFCYVCPTCTEHGRLLLHLVKGAGALAHAFSFLGKYTLHISSLVLIIIHVPIVVQHALSIGNYRYDYYGRRDQGQWSARTRVPPIYLLDRRLPSHFSGFAILSLWCCCCSRTATQRSLGINEHLRVHIFYSRDKALPYYTRGTLP